LRLGRVVEFWQGDVAALRSGRPVVVGYPQDEGVRRNHGRAGAGDAPQEIRRWLYRLTPRDPVSGADLVQGPPLDVGDVHLEGSLEDTQYALGAVVAGILERGAVPVVLGGGHETAYGHYQGYAVGKRPVGVINIDAHLDVRPVLREGGHSGSAFRQAMEHPSHPLPGQRYVCLGLQPQITSRQHWAYARERGCVMHWAAEVERDLAGHFRAACERLAADKGQVYVSIDADAVRSADVPGVSAPNPTGLSGAAVVACARLAGESPAVTSLEIVEVNPAYDADGVSARWAAVLVWNFLVGVASRAHGTPSIARAAP
jgi:formimidoylglutamase